MNTSFFSGWSWLQRQGSVRPGERRRGQRARRWRPGLERLEDRLQPSVTTSLSGGLLTVNLSAANDSAFLAFTGPNTVAVGTSSGNYNISTTQGVTGIVLQDSGSNAGQSATFEGSSAFTLPGGLSSTGIESVAFNQAVDASSGSAAISVNASTVLNVKANLTGGSGGVSLTGGSNAPATQFGVWVGATVRATGIGTVTVQGSGGSSSNLSPSSHQVVGDVGVVVDGGAITSSGGAVQVSGTGGSGSGGNWGVLIEGSISNGGTGSGGSVQVSGTGGTGSNGGSNGILMDAGAVTCSGTGSGATVTVQGTGGSGGNSNDGIVMADGSVILSCGGALQVSGTGGSGTGVGNLGIALGDGTTITTTGTGSGATVTVQGTGTGSEAEGILVDNAVISGGPAAVLTVQGAGVGTSSPGVRVAGAMAQITSSGGDVQITGSNTGTAQTGFAEGVEILVSGTISSGGSGNLTITTDSFNADNTATIKAGANGTGTTTIQTRTAGTLINLGGNNVLTGSPLTLGLSATALADVKTGTLQIGNASSGAITASAPFNVGTATVVFTSGANLNLAINGTTAGNDYQQLNVTGNVNLTGVNLVLSGSLTPTAGSVFTIVTATSVTGTFNGLANNAIVTLNGQSMRVNYTSTAVTLTDVQGSVFGPNLIVNGNGEAGGPGSASGNDLIRPIPGWTPTGNFTVVQYGNSSGFPTTTDPGPSDRGSNFFAGGPSNSSSSASQVIDVSAGATSIDAGGVTFNLSAYLGGWESQGDNAVLTATFQDSQGHSLGTATLGPVTAADRHSATGLLPRSTQGAVPTGTRTINLVLQMTRQAGSYNDGYADDLSLVFQANPNAPTVTMTAPAGGSVTRNNLPTLSANATDHSGTGLAGIQFQVSSDSGKTWQNAGPVETSAPFTFTCTTPLTDGSYQARAIATDNTGATAVATPVSFLVDTTPPTSSVSALPASTSTTSFTVSWSGSDGANGSGIASYTIDVSEDGGPYNPWPAETNTTQTSATFTGQFGHTYCFYSIATDNAGNVQPAPGSGTLQGSPVSSGPVTASLTVSPSSLPAGSGTVTNALQINPGTATLNSVTVTVPNNNGTTIVPNSFNIAPTIITPGTSSDTLTWNFGPNNSTLLYVTSQTLPGLQLVNPSTNSVTTVLTTSSAPDSLIFGSNGVIIYTENSAGEVAIFDPRTGTNTMIAQGFGDGRDITLEPGGKSILLTEFANGNIDRIDLTTHAVTRLSSGISEPQGITYDNKGNLFVVAGGTDSLDQIDPTTGAVLKTITLNATGLLDGVTYDPVTSAFWVSDNSGGLVEVSNYLTTPMVQEFLAPSAAGGVYDGVESDGQGNIYVAAYSNHIVQYTIATNTFTALTSINGLDDLAPIVGTGSTGGATTITWQSQVTNLQGGQTLPVTLGGSVAFTNQGTPGTLTLPGTSITGLAEACTTIVTPLPTVSMTAPADGTVTNNSTPTLSANATDNSGTGLAGVQFQISSDDGMTWQNAGPVETTAPFSFTFSPALAAGTYEAQAIATDNANNSATSTVVTFTILPNGLNYIVDYTGGGNNPFADSADATIHGGTGTPADPFHMASLRGAILASDAAGSASTISLPAGTYTLSIARNGNASPGTTGYLDITGTVTIIGAGQTGTIVQAGASAATAIDRVFTVEPGANATFQTLTIQHGNASIFGEDGGGINAIGDNNSGRNATVTLNHVTVRDNMGGRGAGINNNLATASAALTITDSLVTGNQGTNRGGGIDVTGFGTLYLTRSTVSNNSTTENAGGVALHVATFGVITACTINNNTAGNAAGGVLTFGPGLTISNSTISNNSSGAGGGGVLGGNLTITNSTITGNRAGAGSSGGGIVAGSNSVLRNTIVAGNFQGPGTTPDDISGTISSSSNDLIGDAGTSGGISNATSGNIIGNSGSGTIAIASVLSTTLADNGGPTLTQALVPGSPAINAGNPAFAPSTDQRGLARVAAPDIGAYEFQPAAPTITMTFPANNTVTTNTQPSLSASASDNSGSGLASVQFQYSSDGGQTWTNAGSAETAAPFTFTFTTALANGTYEARAMATDNAGNSTTSAAVTFTISAGTPTVQVSATDRAYNGLAFTATATVNGSASLEGVAPILTYYSGSSANSTPLPSSPTRAGTYTVVATFRGSQDFLSGSSSPVTFHITPFRLTVSAAGQNKVYDGTTQATVTLTDNRVAGDQISITNASATFAGKNVTSTAQAVSVSGIALSGPDSSNYTLGNTAATTSARITPRTLTVNGVTASNKVYDGTTAATLNNVAGAVLQGLVGGDSVTLNKTNVKGAFSSKNAGIGVPVTVTGFSISGPAITLGDYTLVQPSPRANITPKTLTVTGITANSKVYDGTTVATLNLASARLQGVVGGDSITLNTSGSGVFASRNVGNNIPVTVTGLSLSGNAITLGNYTLTQPTTTGNITVRSITVTAAASTKVYDGTTASTQKPTITSGSLASGDSANFTQTFDNPNVGKNKTLTPSGSVLDGNGGKNYKVTFSSSKQGEIDRALLTLQALSTTWFLGQPRQPLKYLITGLVDGDSPSVISGSPVLASPGKTSTTPGTYPITITQGTLSAANYVFQFLGGTLTLANSQLA